MSNITMKKLFMNSLSTAWSYDFFYLALMQPPESVKELKTSVHWRPKLPKLAMPNKKKEVAKELASVEQL